MKDFTELNNQVIHIAQKWKIDTFGNILKQNDKLVEESLELRDELVLCEAGVKDSKQNSEDELGDVMFVTLVLALKMGVDPLECLQRACDKNMHKAGKTENGTFVKAARRA